MSRYRRLKIEGGALFLPARARLPWQRFVGPSHRAPTCRQQTWMLATSAGATG